MQVILEIHLSACKGEDILNSAKTTWFNILLTWYCFSSQTKPCIYDGLPHILPVRVLSCSQVTVFPRGDLNDFLSAVNSLPAKLNKALKLLRIFFEMDTCYSLNRLLLIYISWWISNIHWKVHPYNSTWYLHHMFYHFKSYHLNFAFSTYIL